jgi:CDP-diacylglycerol--glycerol-3-phosphate 3-phosphatidyltransferase/cardiolipin synthase
LWAILAAAATDFLDGFLARLLQAETELGRMLDPIADKAFVLMLTATFFSENAIHPLWALGIATRDVVVTAGIFWVLVRGRSRDTRKMRPSWLGKCTTAGQFVVLLLLALTGEAPFAVWVAVMLLSVAAAVGYARAFAREVLLTRESVAA